MTTRETELAALLKSASMDEQLTVLGSILNCVGMDQSNAFADAMFPVADAFACVFDIADAADNPEPPASFDPGSVHPDNPCKGN